MDVSDLVEAYKTTTLAMLRQRDADPESNEDVFMDVLDAQWERMTMAQHAEIEAWVVPMMAARTPS